MEGDKEVLERVEVLFDKYIEDKIKGVETTEDYKDAVKSLEELVSTASGSRYHNTSKADAHTLFGKIYECGAFNTKKDVYKAYFHYKIAADHNNAYGCYRLGYFYENGVANSVSKRKATYFYKRSANGGCIRGLHRYGMVLLEGVLGCKRDPKNGVFYLGQAYKLATANYPHPIFDYAKCFEVESRLDSFIIPDEPYALKLYKSGAEMGCIRCNLRLGEVYRYGLLGEGKDINKSMEFYGAAAEKKSPEARMLLYTLYSKGVEVEKDGEMAVKWLKKAAEAGHPDAALLYGKALERGEGVPKNTINALWWYRVSYMRGCKEAKKYVVEIERRMCVRGSVVKKDCGIM